MFGLRHALAAAAAAAALAAAPHALAAGYLKLGDIKGESTSANDHKDWIELQSFSWGETNAGSARMGSITLGDDPQAIGLLLPAVQKAREAARAAPRRAAVATYREVADDGTVLKTYWLRDVVLTPAEGRGMKIAYSCKTWRDEASGATGGDCDDTDAARAKGKVEATWKVEKGEK